MNFSRFITHTSALRMESPIRKTTAIAVREPDVLSLASGMPNPSLFPFQEIDITTKTGIRINFSGSSMDKALQYSDSQGTANLLKWVKTLHQHYHNPPLMGASPENGGFNACILSGSQDGLIKVFEMLINPGDNVVLDNPCYSGTLAMLRPMGCNLIPVATDKYGMQSDSLLSVMQQWKPEDSKQANSGIPRILYTIPNGGNPTGATATLERKKEIYEIARKYDMVIVEDDPYYFLQFKKAAASYQSLDEDGRVIRSDSMSKVMSSGLRVGWVSGPSPFIERIILHQQASLLHTSTLVQMMLSSLFDEWGLEGFQNHVNKIQRFYENQRDLCVKACKNWLTGLAEWNIPEGGMFLWMKLHGIDDTTDLLMRKAFDKKVLLLPGSVFEVIQGSRSSYCRASYSFASEDKMNEAFKRLAELIKEERNL